VVDRASDVGRALPTEGRTLLAHVVEALEDALRTITEVTLVVESTDRLRARDRERLWRELAGVIAHCETVRLWLDAGAPR
jgi:hypothetical protein